MARLRDAQVIYQDRETDELRAEAAKVRRELRFGAAPRAVGVKLSDDVDALLALTLE